MKVLIQTSHLPKIYKLVLTVLRLNKAIGLIKENFLKAIKYLAIALTLLLMSVVLTACGDTSDSTSVKDDFKEY